MSSFMLCTVVEAYKDKLFYSAFCTVYWNVYVTVANKKNVRHKLIHK